MHELGLRPRINTPVLLAYLARAGLIDVTGAAAANARVTDLSRSHLVVSVRLGDGRHLIVKRARARPGETVGTLHRELLVYRLACGNPALSAAMPTPLWIDVDRQVLVTEAVEPGTSLHAGAVEQGPPASARARGLARLVAGWHLGTMGSPPAGIRPAEAPWVLGILASGRWRPPECDRLLVHGRVRRDLGSAFAELTAELEPACLVHGDLKWDHCLTGAGSGFRIVDWEHAAYGDPAWDVAGILQDYVAVPRAARQGDGLPGTAPVATEESITAFMTAYLDTAAPGDGDRFAERAARLAGARLVQTALEQVGSGAEQVAADLVGEAVRILHDPHSLLPARSAAG